MINNERINKSKSIIGNRQRIFFIIACLSIPVVHWFVFWLYVNFQSIILAFQDMRTGEFSLEHFATVWSKIKGGEQVL